MAVLQAGMYTFHEAVKSILQTVVANEMMMYCLLSAASCRMRYVDRLPSESVMAKEDHYLSNALRLMSRNVASAGLKEALTCIMFMLSADSYRGELASAKLHLHAAHRLLAPLGGVSAIEDPLQGQMAMGDLFVACVHVEPCLFDCSYNPGPASSLNLSSAELSPHQPLARAFPEGLLGTFIQQLAESYSIKMRLRIPNMAATRAMQASRWITKRCMAIRHDLLELILIGADHALRVGLIMWSLLAMNVTGRSKTVKLMAPSLQAAICDTKDWPDSELRKWLLLVGHQCASEASLASTWFASQLYTLCYPNLPVRSLGLTTAEEVKELTQQLIMFQRGYFYDETVQRPRTAAIANRLLGLRP